MWASHDFRVAVRASRVARSTSESDSLVRSCMIYFGDGTE